MEKAFDPIGLLDLASCGSKKANKDKLHKYSCYIIFVLSGKVVVGRKKALLSCPIALTPQKSISFMNPLTSILHFCTFD